MKRSQVAASRNGQRLSAPMSKSASERDELREKLQREREHLEARQVGMEKALQESFNEWDQIQTANPDSGEARHEKNTVLRSMQEILSNRTYVCNMVNELLETTGV